MKRMISLTTLIAAGAVAMAGMALAETENAKEMTLFSVAQIDIQKALTIALEGVDGKITSIEFESEDGKAVYEAVAVAPDGSMTEILIDANDGSVIAQGPFMDDDDEKDDDNG
ncbi:MAG: PepSY domain-containing protein [Sulfitobacter sp.]|uniref:PepSY domain-containing protein n=1 Tax=Sulfitobacter profundi TaxID=2679961 RepID=A0ABW1YVG1_9RHOB|nr:MULTISPECIES: PepSY domain-containing protein [Sulfitobacter]UWR38791.1 PepSY domain-containing protein [Sulfitobacter sp. W074]WOI15418.1 PepSY domain-containing protein [Sulfitobacter sp. LC.270.F.C4]